MGKSETKWYELSWAECDLVVHKIFYSPYISGLLNESYESLEGQVEIESEDIEEPFAPTILLEQKILSKEKFGLEWELKRPFSKLKVSLQPSYYMKLKQQQGLTQIYAKLCCGYLAQKGKGFYLEEVELFGDKTRAFDEFGDVNFEDIRFSKSSFRKEMKKFSVIVSICAQCEGDENMIIKTYLSQEIHVTPFIARKMIICPEKKIHKRTKKLKKKILENGQMDYEPAQYRAQTS